MAHIKIRKNMKAVFVTASLSSLFLAACSEIRPSNSAADEPAFTSTNTISQAIYEQIHGTGK